MSRIILIPKRSIARYELEIVQKGVCKGLARADFAEGPDFFAVDPELNGLTGIENWLATDRSFVFDGYRRFLHLLRSVAKSLCSAESFLIPAEHLSLDADDIFMDGERARLLPREAAALEESMKKLLKVLGQKYPQTHASYIDDMLPEHYDSKLLLRILTELELDVIKVVL